MKIALIQINPIIGDFSYNRSRIEYWAGQAREQGCDLAIFPELALCGYPPQDLLERSSFIADHQAAFARLVESIAGIGVLCGHLERHTGETGKPLHNSVSLFEDGKVLFTARKRLLPAYDVFDETRYFEPGGSSTPFQYKGLSLGITVCEDIWNDKGSFPQRFYAVDPVSELVDNFRSAGKNIDLLINISASPFNIGKEAIKQEIFARICRDNQLPLIYVNQVGGQDSLLFDGWSLTMDPEGNIAALAARFAEDMVTVDTDSWHGEMHCKIPADTAAGDNEVGSVFDALVMGVRDYAAKCGFSRGVLGLSGGIDSAVTCAIACQALGPENVMGVALPSPYSSQESVEDAEQLASNLGCRFETMPITAAFSAVRESLQPVFAKQPGEPVGKPDVTEQNIQARIRGNLLMALSNKYGSLLLSTGNKSEMAVGYCTLYGDMSGGLAVIADVPKILVYKLARFINRAQQLVPARTITKPPSAELAPDQLDQDDLPPYEILDPILKAYLEENKGTDEIVASGFERRIVEDVVRRIKMNEYKRKQAPIGLKVTSKAFGYGRRYPTAQNYREEHGTGGTEK